MTPEVSGVLAEVDRAERARLVARLIRITGDWALAEDCVQDAFVRAWESWPRDGLPDRPAAWLSATAKNAALDRWRRTRVEAEKLRLIALEGDATEDGDDRLALIFTCCHPALSLEAQVALTLRTVAGLSTGEVARAFLVSEQTMTRRLTRARTKIQEAGIPLRVPTGAEAGDRQDGVLGVLYLLFNRGNDAGPSDQDQLTLGREAIRLARLLDVLVPRQAEVKGALALMLLTWARRPARYDEKGAFVSLDQQDRSLWDQTMLAEGLTQLDEALSLSSPGVYALQAAIAGCHARAPRAAETDFGQIAGLYARLDRLAPSAVVRLNHAVARGLADGPGVGLALADALVGDPVLVRYHLLPAVRADFLARLGRTDEAAAAYREAEALAPSDAERRLLAEKRGRLTAPPSLT